MCGKYKEHCIQMLEFLENEGSLNTRAKYKPVSIDS